MKLIQGTPRSGKTYKLIIFASLNNSTIVCINRKACENIIQMANEMKVEIKQPITFEEFIRFDEYSRCNKIQGADIDNLVIDNVDYFLNYISPATVPIKALTIGAYHE